MFFRVWVRELAHTHGLIDDRKPMIKLTRLGGESFVLNADLIRYIEQRPDTFITLNSGDRIVVTESMDEVLRRSVVYQQAKHLLPRFERPMPLSEQDSDRPSPGERVFLTHGHC